MKNVLGIFASPGETFGRLKEKPTWLIPLVIVVGFGVLSSAALFRKVVVPTQIERLTSNPDIPEEQMKKVKMTMGGTRGMVIALVGPAVAVPIVSCILAGLLCALSSILGGDVTFKKMFSLVCHSSLIGVLASIIKVPIMFVKGSMSVHTSLALIVPNMSTTSNVFQLLSKVDIFTIWQVYLVGLGLSIMSGISSKKSTISIFLLWVVWVAISVFLLGRLRMGM
jgi:hypothetical protein